MRGGRKFGAAHKLERKKRLSGCPCMFAIVFNAEQDGEELWGRHLMATGWSRGPAYSRQRDGLGRHCKVQLLPNGTAWALP